MADQTAALAARVAAMTAVDAAGLPHLLRAAQAQPFRFDMAEAPEDVFQAFDPSQLPRAVPVPGVGIASEPEAPDPAALGPDDDALIAPDEREAPEDAPHAAPRPTGPQAQIIDAGSSVWEEAHAAGYAEGHAAGYADGHRAGLTEGHAAGLAEGQGAAEAQVAEAARHLAAAHARLTDLRPEDVAQLAQAIETAVRALAAERAGQLIDAGPLPFVARIEALADRVGQGVREITLRLSPPDHAALLPHLPGSDVLSEARVVADPRLQRGDVEVRAPGIRLADLLPQLPQPGTSA